MLLLRLLLFSTFHCKRVIPSHPCWPDDVINCNVWIIIPNDRLCSIEHHHTFDNTCLSYISPAWNYSSANCWAWSLGIYFTRLQGFKTSFKFIAWTSNYIYLRICDINCHPCPNSNGSLGEPLYMILCALANLMKSSILDGHQICGSV